jgi:hypothetical protein
VFLFYDRSVSSEIVSSESSPFVNNDPIRAPSSTAAELVIDEELVPPPPDPVETLLTMLADGLHGSIDHVEPVG